MGLAEARADLLVNKDKLYIVTNRDGEAWRTTLAGTKWVMFRWGYREGQLTYELHVHGNASCRVTESSHESKVCGSGMKGGQSYLDSTDWTAVKGKVKELLGQR